MCICVHAYICECVRVEVLYGCSAEVAVTVSSALELWDMSGDRVPRYLIISILLFLYYPLSLLLLISLTSLEFKR